MTTNSWKTGVNGDWTDAADWSDNAVPSNTDTVTVAAPGAYTVTLYTTGVAAALILNDPGLLFYDSGTLSVSGTTSLLAGTLDLAYGTLQGGTLSFGGGVFESSGGTLSGVTIQNTLNLAPANTTLFVQNGLTLQGVGGAGAGSITLTGSNAALDFVGSQSLSGATITLGAFQGGVATLGVTHAFGATSGATLTLGSSLWIQQTGGLGDIAIGNALSPPISDSLVNQGTITASGGTLTISGTGTFINQGIIGVSGGATLDIASGGFANSGIIDVADATLEFGGTFATALLSNLGSLDLSQAVVEIGGIDLNTGTTLTVSPNAALGAIALAGTITGGTVTDSGGGLTFGPGTGVLNDVIYQGNLELTGANNAVTLTGGSGLVLGAGNGTATVTGAGAALLLEGIEAFGHATISLGSNTGVAELGTADPWVGSTATTATLGMHLVVQQAGLYAAVDANAQTPLPGVGLSDTLINLGLITGAVAGGTLTIGGYGTFINSGTISVSNGDTLLLDAGVFSNTGTVTVSGGAVAVLGGPANLWGTAPAWSNTGTILVSGATLQLSGNVTTGQLGKISSTGGIIALTGTLANTGSTLTLGNAGQLPALSLAGTIIGGRIVDPNALLSAGSTGAAELEAVSYVGTLGLEQPKAYLRIYEGLTLAGLANITGAGAVLAFEGTQTFNASNVNLGATGGATIDVIHDYSNQGGSTLTLGPSLLVTQAGQSASIGLPTDLAGDGIVNQGSIGGGVAGGTLTLGGAAFSNAGTIAISNGDTLQLSAGSFSNTGHLSVTNATLSLADTVSLGQLGNLTLSNASLSIGGTLNATSGTLFIGAGTQWGRVNLTGTIDGGTIFDEAMGLEAQGNATLEAVSYRGTLNLSRPFEDLNITDGIHMADLTGTLASTMFITGAADRVLMTTSETLPNCYVYIGSNTTNYFGQIIPAPQLDAGPGVTLTIGQSTTIRTGGTYSTIGNAALGDWTDTILNTGTFMATTSGCTMDIGSSFFINGKSLLIGNDGNVLFSGVEFENQGSIAIVLGSNMVISLYDYYAAPDAGTYVMTNTGTIRMLGGVLAENTGNGTFPSVPIENLGGGLIQGLGTVLAPLVNNGTIESQSGPVLALQEGVTGTGTLLIDQSCILELNGAVVSSQGVQYTGTTATLKLDTPFNFAASVAGFGGSDILDLSNNPVTGIAISNGTLAASTAAGVFHLNSASALAGELSVWSDGKNGSDISYTAQPQGGNPVVIPVNQPGMLFWASPVGDEFQGPTWEMNAISINNWSTTDSLDFTDMNGSSTVSYIQGSGQGTLTVTNGAKTGHVVLLGTFNGAWFHAGSDGHGGALITYVHP